LQGLPQRAQAGLSETGGSWSGKGGLENLKASASRI
jgi:hypothetical protein